MADLAITVDGRDLSAAWTDENPHARRAIDAALPLEGEATRWGDELYFSTPVECDPERTRRTVPVGAVAYWPAGQALCLFWGPTPASADDRPRAGAPVAVVATLEDVTPLAGLSGGARVRLSATD